MKTSLQFIVYILPFMPIFSCGNYPEEATQNLTKPNDNNGRIVDSLNEPLNIDLSYQADQQVNLAISSFSPLTIASESQFKLNIELNYFNDKEEPELEIKAFRPKLASDVPCQVFCSERGSRYLVLYHATRSISLKLENKLSAPVYAKIQVKINVKILLMMI